MQLRPYQIEQLEFLKKDDNAGVVQAPTGTGKSVVCKAYVDWFQTTRRQSRIMLVTPNQTLNRNMTRYLSERATMAHTGYKPDLTKSILVTTFQSAKKYIEKFKPDLIIGDELHRVEAKTYKEIMQLAPIRKGFTATPNRHDGKGLDSLFDDLYLSPQISWFINQGYLSDYDLMCIDAPLFESSNDDYNKQSEIFGSKPEIEKTIKTYKENARGQTLIFCTNISHGIKLKERFLKENIKAAFVCSTNESDNLQETLENFRDEKINVLINCQMFIEGVDIPQIETLMLCVFVYSTPKFLQMVGRLLRLLPGIDKKLLIDLTGCVYYHGNPRSAFFDWNLEGYQVEKNVNNKSTNWHYCFACDEPIARKKHILEPSDICCLHCGATQYVIPALNRKKVEFEGETFTLSNYTSEVLDSLATASKIARSHYTKYSKGEKLAAIAKLNLLPWDLKIKAMLATGASHNTIEQYL